MSGHLKIGLLGEELVARFLMKRGYKIIDRNFRRPWGELDVVAENKGLLHFIEVKTLSSKVSASSEDADKSVTQETSRAKALNYIRSGKPKDWFRPEDNVSTHKIKRLGRIIQTYLMGRHVSSETSWQFDVATVLIDRETKKAKINFIWDLVIDA